MHLLRILLIVIVFGSVATNAQSQQRYFDERYIYSQNFIHPVLVNPGATGIQDYQQLILNYRNTWATFEDAPKTITLNFNGPIGNRLGFGAQLFRDSFGALETSKGMLSLSYTIDSEKNRLGFGLSTEYIQHIVSGSALNNEIVDIDDLTLLQRLDGNQFFDASFGVYGIYDESFKYGVSFPSLISSKINIEDGDPGERDLGYIAHFAYSTRANNSDIGLEPSIFIKSLNNIPTHVDLNLKATFLDDQFTGAVGYTLGADKRIGFLLGAAVDNLNFYYSYNISTRAFQDYNNGAHELSVSFSFNKDKKKATTAVDAPDPMNPSN
jgi:type IX secretion system PorP/SprF family membrane protein